MSKGCKHEWEVKYFTPHSDYVCKKCGERRYRLRVCQYGIRVFDLSGKETEHCSPEAPFNLLGEQITGNVI